jgi:hypothetical protein
MLKKVDDCQGQRASSSQDEHWVEREKKTHGRTPHERAHSAHMNGDMLTLLVRIFRSIANGHQIEHRLAVKLNTLKMEQVPQK